MNVSLSYFSELATVEVPSHDDLRSYLADVTTRSSAIRVHRDGRSRQGRELFCVEAGTGEKVIGITAGAHSDEPPGTATCYQLIQNLADNPKLAPLLQEFTFVIFPMLDPDGAALNSRWAKTLSYRDYFLHHFRNNDPGDDCEHGIPVSEEQTARPELAFFKRHIDRYRGRIHYYVTLHTTHVLGGALFVVDQDFQDSRIIAGLSRLCTELGLPLMDYQARGDDSVTYVSPGFLGAPSVAMLAEKYKNHPEILPRLRMSTYEYVLRRCGGKFALISELPLWVDARMTDCSDTDVPLMGIKRKILQSKQQGLEQIAHAVAEIKSLRPNKGNPWLTLAEFLLQFGPKMFENELAELPRYEGVLAQKADLCDNDHLELHNQLKVHRFYIKVLEDSEQHSERVSYHHSEFNRLFDEFERASSLRQIPLAQQIRIQLGMILEGMNGP